MSPETVLWAACAFWTLSANGLFFRAAIEGHDPWAPATWAFVLALGASITAAHFVMLAPWVTTRTLKPVLGVLVVVTAAANWFMQVYGAYLDPAIVRSVLQTDAAESRELLSWPLLGHVLVFAAGPLLLLWRLPTRRRALPRALGVRVAWLAAAALLTLISLWVVFQPFSSLMRNHKDVRYLVTPANYLWSLGAVLVRDTRAATAPRQPVGLDAVRVADGGATVRPVLFVLVVGETARAANWGLNGSARQTTPELAQRDVIAFTDVTSCGSNTEVSLPCMFAPVGRRAYDERRIRGSESMLHVAARAGIDVHWRDNQTGCKGVCEGLPQDQAATSGPAALCADGRCLDEALLFDLDERIDRAHGAALLVLHQIGNHGPSYFRRYPASFERFSPACRDDDLRHCTREEIVNAYDNALLYTDHVLAHLIDRLQARAGDVDSAVLYVSDHGESLGEKGLYLHGLPYAIAPTEQTHVPMALWLSEGMQRRAGLDMACLRQRARAPASHDHLFHTVLGLLDVQTSSLDPAWDLTLGCRKPGPAA